MAAFTVSVITMDHINLENDIKIVDKLGVDGLHIDIMDGHFVPRYGIYPEIVERINEASNLPLDLHFMVENLLFSLSQFRNARNVKTITFHLETCIGNELRVVDKIREIGAKPVVGINLATSFNNLERLVVNNEIEGVMLMGIHPGVLKQTPRPDNILKDLSSLKKLLLGTSSQNYIGLDGAVNFNTMPKFIEAGITYFVGGSSSIFKNVLEKDNKTDRIEKIHQNWQKVKNILRHKNN